MELPPNSGKILLWAAWIIFLASLWLPMERYDVPGPCAWPCLYPFTYVVGSNALMFVLSMVSWMLYVLYILYTGEINKEFWIFTLYSVIGLGQILLLLAPFLAERLKHPSQRMLLLISMILSTLAILGYAIIPNLRFGVDALQSGYYVWVSSFLMIILAMILGLRMGKE